MTYIVFIGMIFIYPAAMILSAIASDSFADGMLRDRFHPVWIGVGVATVIVVSTSWLIRISARRMNSSRQMSMRQLTGALLFLFTYLVFSGWMLSDASERLLVRATSRESRYYLTYAQPASMKCQNPVAWYDRQVDGMVSTCTTFALFNHPVNSNARRASIVHVLTGPYGIRVLSIHAIDSSFRQQDLKQLRDSR